MGLVKWFNHKTKLKKILICSTIILVIVLIILFICFLTLPGNTACQTPACLRSAVYILDTVDQNVDPCDDFYAFACGNFMKMAMITKQPTTINSLRELASNQLQQIVQETTDDTDLPKSLVYQRTFYRSCIDVERIEDDEDKTFLRLLDEVIGGWPVLKMSNWMGENFHWKSAMIKARKLGLYHELFFKIELYENITTEEFMLWVRPLDTYNIDSFHFNDSYVDEIYDVVKELGANSVDITNDLRATSTFAEHLKEISKKHLNKSWTSDIDDKKSIRVSEINNTFTKLDWVAFLKEMTGIDVKESDRIIFDIETYIQDLYDVLRRTPKRIQANYVAWIHLSTNFHYMSEKVRDKYNRILHSDVTMPPQTRSERCYKLGLGLYRMTSEAEYIRRYTTPEKKKQVQLMIDYIKSEMSALIEASPWMDEENREHGMKRLKNITAAIGWLDNAFNVTKIEELTGYIKVQKLPVGNEHPIDLARLALKIKYDSIFSQVGLKTNYLDVIGIPGVEVNAYFVRLFNILILPTPILQGQMFDLNRPYYLNFGALGTVIGHELTHGFTLYYNLDQVTADDGPADLWTSTTATQRMEIAQCVDDEYNNFQIMHGRNRTNHTSGEENIADFNGVNIAYTAYQNWIRYNGRESNLPGIKYTPNQLFWIMASTYMCFEPKLSDKEKVLGKDPNHGMPEFRVIGRIRHSPYFAHDFDCPVGSKMNPKEKCRVFV